MGNGVKVNYSELEPLRTELNNIISEFESAGARRRDLEHAVGSPYGESALRDAASEFERRWDDRRKQLTENCQAVADHLETVITGFQDFDADMATKFESED
ncbi:hypothetical protein [Microbacterium imperiale]|uniref:Flagellar protein FlgN n=1 Tax=Microbacterium imperiale TaxID=33884 RepID=A0A9W6HEH9_9MICO|nr:hypothetical protein [Microbacterium imperiale]MBP2420360.1 uncharacterized protein YukE [Microbacterium imperiale]MDS0197780.1 hypothetical protein [Microbacterium imperiale]BFE40703.1 hypothetical protein GCM10017544_16590 [Microbacterium imperiale]GLJ78323.1 hypothetical protein GCM10017586_00050 [Microbacterium imperiale]